MIPSVSTVAATPRRLNLESLLAILERQGHVLHDQLRAILMAAGRERARLLRERFGPRVTPQQEAELHPAEVLAACKLDSAVPGPPAPLGEDAIMQAVAAFTGLPFLKIDPLKIEADMVVASMPRPFAQRNAVVPVAHEGELLVVAVADPFDKELQDSLGLMTRGRWRPVVATPTDIRKLITDVYGFRTAVSAAAREAGTTGLPDLGNLEQYVKLKKVDEIDATDKHVVNAVEFLLHYAFDQRASDIHIEPRRETSRIRLRIDGVLHEVNNIPRQVHPAFISRIKMLSRMDVAERRKPQDGRIKTGRGEREVELRVSTLPVAFGEKCVIRIFDPDVLTVDLADLGFFPRDLAIVQGFLDRPHGLVLVSGPTGSGKTTTLYSALRRLANDELNITTIEDPIEMVMDEFNQVAVQPQAGVTFASALRHILRQDPDVIMVGEIRDRETAEHAVQAALTGHLVLSTVHTNDAPSSVTRLIELGVEPFLVASTLLGVIAQRLVRKVCKACADSRQMTFEELAAIGMEDDVAGPERPRCAFGKGCVHCRGTGMVGRTGVHEVLEVSERVRSLITERRDAGEIARAAIADGMGTLRQCALQKLRLGVTTFEEIIRVTTE